MVGTWKLDTTGTKLVGDDIATINIIIVTIKIVNRELAPAPPF